MSVVTHSPSSAQKVGSQIKQIIRSNYSNPPRFGAMIIAAILKSPERKKAWMHEVQAMRDRIVEMREALTFGLQERSLHKDFSFLNKQKGIFSFSGLNRKQVNRLRDERGIYMAENGRMSVAGLNSYNLDYVIESILYVSQE
jgi:aromatic-amino-acid transaminase